MAEVSPGVAIVETSVAEGRIGVVAGEDVALVVDAGIDDAEGLAVLEAARASGCPDIRLAYTHAHADHALGGSVFRGYEILARAEVVEHMRAQLGTWASRGERSIEDLERSLGWPTIILEDDTVLELGGRRVRLFSTPGHAPGAICVLEPEAGVLFGGDTVVTAIPPAFRDGDSAVLERTLRRLASLEAEVLIPGHGGVVLGAAHVRAAITWSADYLARCREHVMAHPQADADAIVASADYDRFIGDHLPRQRHRMEWRHEQTIRSLFEEVRHAR